MSLFPRGSSAERAATPAQRAPEGQAPLPPRNRVAEEAPRVLTASREELWSRAESLAWRLSANLGMPVRLAVTDNRSTMVSFRRGSQVLQLRLHHMFLDAPEVIVRAVADYAGRGHRAAGALLDEYIRGQQPLIRQLRRESDAELNPLGRCFDLRALYNGVNEAYFGNAIQARIGWGRMPPRRRRKSIRLGVYDHQTREIRIHPALDKPDVPAFFVEFIVFHEMLHQLFPSSNRTGRRVHHPRAFRERERTYPHYAAALRWERENLGALLRG
ncbi:MULTISPECIES: hypothetical protein [unclassified Corallococcus]|uniref:hypothetical protein n=1 Tax=unclassified Corallococcus TaxID=2685029 RepID=UPI001A8E8078|nr:MULTISPECIES: hypothetical protein [unclassified Corallococcus]MBN9682567.1 hypothetical protein [Corallococcus sp. NCSPR001]WAS89540.1 hypothetical protein O0N60_02680 [Corallococcus sp. NCRR]